MFETNKNVSWDVHGSVQGDVMEQLHPTAETRQSSLVVSRMETVPFLLRVTTCIVFMRISLSHWDLVEKLRNVGSGG